MALNPVGAAQTAPLDNTKLTFKQRTDTIRVVAVGGAAYVAIGTNPTIEYSNANFKEVGVIGGEAIRTFTEEIGDYKLGINTVARLPHDAYQNAWTGIESGPRANLDVVGTAFISGRTTGDFLDHTNRMIVTGKQYQPIH